MSRTSKLRILFITRAYSAQAGGMERLSWEAIQALSTRSDIDAEIVAHRTSHGATLAAARRTSALFVLTALPQALRQAAAADIVHLGDPALSYLGWLIQRIFRKPIAVTVHGLDIAYPNPAYQFYLKLFFRTFTAYLPISHYVDTLLASRHTKGTSVVINPGAHDRLFDPTISRSRLTHLLAAHGLQLTDDATVLLTSGRLVARKGHAWFIEYVLPKLPPSTYYVIAGDGPERAPIERTARSQGLSKRIVLLGRVPEYELKILYNTIDAFIHPSLHLEGDVEGFGMVLLEAALCMRPVFAANVDGIPDALHNGKNGVLIKGGNVQAWVQVLRNFFGNPTAHHPSGQEARAYTLATFSWNQAIEKYIETFKKLATQTQ